MRPKIPFHPSCFLLLLTFLFSFDRCSDKCQVKNQYVYYQPVYTTLAELRAAIVEKTPQGIKNLGKIYYKDGILFINEVGEGIHIIDNHDPSQPVPIAFLSIPGNLDLAIQGHILYADSYIDLVALDISDIQKIKEVNRIEGLFQSYNTYGSTIDPEKGIITSWDMTQTTVVTQNDCEVQIQPWGGANYNDGLLYLSNSQAAPSKTMIAPGSATGVGGSMARFTIMNHFLYGLDGGNLDVVDISTESNPVMGATLSVGWDAQTLFPYNDHLFVGGRAGMYIFDLSAPAQPSLISQYDHILSCDPVVAEGDYAYVTLYSGDLCHVDTNQLEVVNIKDLAAPSLAMIYPMTSPHGLGISNGILFICDGVDGLKIYDASDPLHISDHLLAHYEKINALDIIPLDNIAMMIGSDGISQYDFTDVNNIKLLSQIMVTKIQ